MKANKVNTAKISSNVKPFSLRSSLFMINPP
jgi:hypothetical protein